MSRSLLGLLFFLPGVAVSQASASRPTQQAVFAGGCFWGVDAVFKHVHGVVKVVSGYAGGAAATADYETVSTGTTGHAESVEVTFDPAQITYDRLLEIFFTVAHDPTERDRQGPDVGTQYRSAIFYSDETQRHSALTAITRLTQGHAFPAPIVTEVVRLGRFYPAEAYHQDYLAQHMTQPYIVYNDLPKLDRLKQRFPALYRQ
jgi:peptide-methionine (S)-S-oxide reductase